MKEAQLSLQKLEPYLDERQRGASEDKNGEEDDDESRGDDDMTLLIVKFEMERESVSNSSAQTCQSRREINYVVIFQLPQLK